MIMNGQVLSNEEIDRIHRDSIRILEEVGVKVPLEQALTLLEAAGAAVDWDSQTALISEAMVDEALRNAPKEFTLGARNPAFDFHMPSAATTLNMDGAGVNAIDFDTGKRRSGTMKDLADAGRIFEEIPAATVLWSCLAPGDVSGTSQNVVGSGVSLINCSKHLQDEVTRIEEVPYIIEMCRAILGSEEEIFKRKIYSVTYCTVAPLCHDRDMLEATMKITDYGTPILVYPMPSCGSTGPAGLYSNVALANAEELSAFVIFQLAHPGTPLIYGAALGTIDAKRGTFMEGAVETGLMLAAMDQMGKHYGFPRIIAGCLSDANEPGMQAVMEKTLTTVPLVMTETDVIQGIGLVEGSMTLSLEQMLIDEEIFNLCRRMKQGIDVSAEKDYFEDIRSVSHGGHYLMQKSTRKAFRSNEFYKSKVFGTDTYDTWLTLGSPTMIDAAHARVKEILESEPKNPLDRNTEKTILEIMEEARAKL